MLVASTCTCVLLPLLLVALLPLFVWLSICLRSPPCVGDQALALAQSVLLWPVLCCAVLRGIGAHPVGIAAPLP